MRKFTFYDSKTNRTKKTKHWFGLLTFCMMLIGQLAFCSNHSLPRSFVWIDDTCLAPTSLAENNITSDSAELSWVSGGTLFEIEYGEIGFTQGTGISVTGITGNSQTLTN